VSSGYCRLSSTRSVPELRYATLISLRELHLIPLLRFLHRLRVIAGFHVVYHFFGLPPSAGLDELEAKGQRFCDTEWPAIAAKRGGEVHVEHYCFRQFLPTFQTCCHLLCTQVGRNPTRPFERHFVLSPQICMIAASFDTTSEIRILLCGKRHLECTLLCCGLS